MPHHQLQIPLVRHGDQLAAVVAAGGHGFLDEEVLSRFENFAAEWEMGAHGRGHHHRIYVRVACDVGVVGCRTGVGIQQSQVVQTVLVQIRYGNKLALRQPVEIPDEVGSPLATADDTDLDHCRSSGSDTRIAPSRSGAQCLYR